MALISRRRFADKSAEENVSEASGIETTENFEKTLFDQNESESQQPLKESTANFDGPSVSSATENDDEKNSEVAAKVVKRRVVRKPASSEHKNSANENSIVEKQPESSESGVAIESKKAFESAAQEEGSENAVQTNPSPESSSNPNPNNEKKNNNNNNRNNRFGKNRFQNRQQTPQERSAAREAAIEAALTIENPEEYASKPRILINDLTKMSMPQLRDKAVEYGFPADELPSMRKQELIFVILKSHMEHGGIIFASGSLEVLPDGYGFLRSPQNSYLPGSDDIYISPAQIRLFNLKTGDTVYGQIRSPKEGEKFFALLRIETVNGDDPRVALTRVPFDNLTPLYPQEQFVLETESKEISTRIVDLFSPIGKGQRLLIVAPPKAGKTTLMQKVANAITKNNPEVYMIVLLIDERPEEVTEMERTINAEVISSTFDEQATRHVQVAEMVLEKAKRLVEHKRDVVIILDSITRLARAYNQTQPTSGKVLSGGVDSNSLHKPKRFFGAARNIEEGGSLTIISTALIETGSRMDEVIFEEFKGTGNSEIDLDRKIAERRIFPAINIKKSGTRKEELLLNSEKLNKMYVLRNFISGMEDVEIISFIIDKMKKSKDNNAFIAMMNTGSAAL